jgi:ABC-type phosphate transport system substrate-binding protein
MLLINRRGCVLAGLALSLGCGTVDADVVAVVSVKSSVGALSKAQVADIFLGKTNRFPDGLPATPVDLTEDSAIRDEFYEKIAGKSAAQIKAYWSRIIFTGRGQPPPNVATNVEMKKRISGNPSAIGYIDRSLVDDSVKIVF